MKHLLRKSVICLTALTMQMNAVHAAASTDRQGFADRASPTVLAESFDAAAANQTDDLHAFEPVQLADARYKRGQRAKGTSTFQPSRSRAFKSGGSGPAKGPATINCDIESSEECEKIVVCTPNCSTEHMQGADCC